MFAGCLPAAMAAQPHYEERCSGRPTSPWNIRPRNYERSWRKEALEPTSRPKTIARHRFLFGRGHDHPLTWRWVLAQRSDDRVSRASPNCQDAKGQGWDTNDRREPFSLRDGLLGRVYRGRLSTTGRPPRETVFPGGVSVNLRRARVSVGIRGGAFPEQPATVGRTPDGRSDVQPVSVRTSRLPTRVQYFLASGTWVAQHPSHFACLWAVLLATRRAVTVAWTSSKEPSNPHSKSGLCVSWRRNVSHTAF